MAKNWSWYIMHDDLLGCYERYKQAYKNWKNHWWETLEAIYNQSAKWAEKYILDPINRTLTAITRMVSNIRSNGNNTCYWVRLIGESGITLYNKIGTTTKTVEERMNGILKDQYKDGYENIVDYDIIASWDCGKNAPEGLESYLRRMLIKKYNSQNFVRNDRFFIGIDFSEPTVEEMNNWAKQYLENA